MTQILGESPKHRSPAYQLSTLLLHFPLTACLRWGSVDYEENIFMYFDKTPEHQNYTVCELVILKPQALITITNQNIQLILTF